MSSTKRSLGDAAQIEDNTSEYSAVTPEKLKRLYPTSEWQERYHNAVRR